MLIIIVIIIELGAIDINFQEITKEDKQLFDRFFHDRYYENSHLNFTNLFMWRQSNNIMWALKNDILYLKASWDDKEFALQPLGRLDQMPEAIENLMGYFSGKSFKFRLFGIEQFMVDALRKYDQTLFDIEADRDNFDYVYSSQDLIDLSGRKYHSKKNHFNSFRKNYPEAQYLPVTEDIMIQCKLNINGWYKKHGDFNDPVLAAERNAIIEVLNNFAEFGLQGAALMLDKRVIAFTFGERLNTDTAVIHVEKADPDIRGAYTVINQTFVENVWSDMKYINREEDMGIEGLRKVKLSYKPVKFIEKFNIHLK